MARSNVVSEPLDFLGPEQRLESVIAALRATQTSGRVGYWADFTDEHGVAHWMFTTDAGLAEGSPENASRRASAIQAFGNAVDRYRAALDALRDG